MISKLRGVVDTVYDSAVVLDVNGVGYILLCSQNTLRTLPSTGEFTTLYVEVLIRAEQITLYGFGTEEERETFRILLTVQGVGGKVCLALLSSLTPAKIQQAILLQDHTLLTQADGVGPKLATRIVRELKDKMSSYEPLAIGAPLTSGPLPTVSFQQEAISALVNLGYRRIEAMDAVLKSSKLLGEGGSLNKLIPLALQQLTKV